MEISSKYVKGDVYIRPAIMYVGEAWYLREIEMRTAT